MDIYSILKVPVVYGRQSDSDQVPQPRPSHAATPIPTAAQAGWSAPGRQPAAAVSGYSQSPPARSGYLRRSGSGSSVCGDGRTGWFLRQPIALATGLEAGFGLFPRELVYSTITPALSGCLLGPVPARRIYHYSLLDGMTVRI